jgi:hypothetical protein
MAVMLHNRSTLPAAAFYVARRVVLGLKSCFLVGAALSISVSFASAQDRSTETAGLSLHALVPELHNARVGAIDDIPENQRRIFVPEDDLGWQFEGDFDSDGRTDTVLLGLYEEHGFRKSFALFATRRSNGWVKTKVFTFAESFVIARNYDTGLVVFHCTHCDYGHRVVWTGSDFVLRPTPLPGVPTEAQ